MKHLGDFDLSTVVYGKFTTFRPSTGAAFTLGGTPALSVYKDNSVTQSTTGVTLTADFDSVTGLNHFAIDTSADGTFYSSGSFFDIVITTGTVDSVSVVGSVVASFTLRKNSSLKPATAGRNALVDANGVIDARLADAVSHGGTLGSSTATLALSRVNVTSQTSNTSALTVTGNGTGSGAVFTSGTGATGDGVQMTAASTNGQGLIATGAGSKAGIRAVAGASGSGFEATGATAGMKLFSVAASGGIGLLVQGDTSGDAAQFYVSGIGAGNALSLLAGTTGNALRAYGGSTSGDAIVATTTSGHAVSLTATGTSKHGLVVTGGSAGTSDGIKAVAGTGGVPIRGDITGNITGNLSGSIGSVAAGGITAASFAADSIDATALAATAANEIRDAVWAKVLSEETGDPGATPAASSALMLPYMGLRNKREMDSTLGTDKLYNSAGTAILSASVSDTGTVITKAKYA